MPIRAVPARRSAVSREAFPDTGAETEAELGEDQRLRPITAPASQIEGVQQPDREADRQLVDADREAESACGARTRSPCKNADSAATAHITACRMDHAEKLRGSSSREPGRGECSRASERPLRG